MLSSVLKRCVPIIEKAVRSMSGPAQTNFNSERHRMIWVDLEMTGLEVETDHILEIACLVTDADLGVIAQGPNLVIHQPDSVLDSMNDWCKVHHGQSGLTDAVRKSPITLPQAESQVLKFVLKHTPAGACPLAGNSVHADRMFLSKYMPHFTKHMHYRIVDVSSVKELCRRWYPKRFEAAPKKQLTHRAMDDILESIEELKYYRMSIFQTGTKL